MKRSTTDIEKILNSLDGIVQAEARPFMFTRVMARLQEENSFSGKVVNFLKRPAIAAACLLAVLLGNAYTVFKADPAAQETPQASIPSTVSDVLQNDNYILAVNDVN